MTHCPLWWHATSSARFKGYTRWYQNLGQLQQSLGQLQEAMQQCLWRYKNQAFRNSVLHTHVQRFNALFIFLVRHPGHYEELISEKLGSHGRMCTEAAIFALWRLIQYKIHLWTPWWREALMVECLAELKLALQLSNCLKNNQTWYICSIIYKRPTCTPKLRKLHLNMSKFICIIIFHFKRHDKKRWFHCRNKCCAAWGI